MLLLLLACSADLALTIANGSHPRDGREESPVHQ